MKNLTDFRKTVETGVDPRLFSNILFLKYHFLEGVGLQSCSRPRHILDQIPTKITISS